MTTPTIGQTVRFRPARMYGYPVQPDYSATIESVRPDGRVNLIIDDPMCSGTAGAVVHRDKTINANESCWWEGHP